MFTKEWKHVTLSPIKRINIIRQILNHRGDEIDVNKRIYYLQKLKTYIDECQKTTLPN